MEKHFFSTRSRLWRHFRQHYLGMIGLLLIVTFLLIAIFAPFLAASKPLYIQYAGESYFPLFRYLFYTGYYSKPLDIFYNLLIYSAPAFLLTLALPRRVRLIAQGLIIAAQIFLFFYFSMGAIRDPASNAKLNRERQKEIQTTISSDLKLASLSALYTSFPKPPDWKEDLHYMNTYAKLNLVTTYQLRKKQHERLLKQVKGYSKPIPSLWQINVTNQNEEKVRLQKYLENNRKRYLKYKAWFLYFASLCPMEVLPEEQAGLISIQLSDFSFQQPRQIFLSFKEWGHNSFGSLNTIAFANCSTWLPKLNLLITKMRIIVSGYESAEGKLTYIEERTQWLENENAKIGFQVWPLLRTFHWEDDAGGDQNLNRYVRWWELTRTNRKDLAAALIFGTRIALAVGFVATSISLLIGIPFGSLAGYYGGSIDIALSRLLEIWQSLPIFFMLLLIVAMLQIKSIFLVIAAIGAFGWPVFSLYTRGEFFKQRNLPYVEACHAQGFSSPYIMFFHILPNAFPPVLTLVPFAIMGAITSEASLAFLGLGEEGSCSWGVLMDEARRVFPEESYLLWPPAILFTLLLVGIALIGDALRDALDPRISHADEPDPEPIKQV